jgi:ribose transport system permease protein
MTTGPASDTASSVATSGVKGQARSQPRAGLRWSSLAFSKVGGVYVLLLIIVVFGILEPNRFLTMQTAKTILNQYSVTGLVALSLVVPLAAGMFDLSVGAQMGFSSMLVAVFVEQEQMSMALAIALVLAVGVLIGLVNALIIVVLRIDSFIATLGSGAIISALTVGVSANRTITGARLSSDFGHNIALRNFNGVTIPVLYLLVFMVVLGILLEQTRTGRYWYAIGFDADAARLAGVPVKRLQAVSLLISGFIASVAGVVLTARISAGTPGAGEPYLLPAFAAVFLGATQFRSGRFNAWGTVLAVMLVGTGTYGLALTSAPEWAPNVFTGAVLIAAVGLTSLERRKAGASAGGLVALLRRLRTPDTPSSGVKT